MYLALWESRRWRLPATPALIFPVAVSLKRFLAPDFVFSFGISLRSKSPVLWRIDEPPWHAMGQAAPKGGADTRKAAQKQGSRRRPYVRNGTRCRTCSANHSAGRIRAAVSRNGAPG